MELSSIQNITSSDLGKIMGEGSYGKVYEYEKDKVYKKFGYDLVADECGIHKSVINEIAQLYFISSLDCDIAPDVYDYHISLEYQIGIIMEKYDTSLWDMKVRLSANDIAFISRQLFTKLYRT